MRRQVLQALRSCATEADIVQVLYASLRPALGYDAISLQVLEREGWYHATTVDQGVLQDVRRRPLAASIGEPLYRQGRTHVFDPGDVRLVPSRGPGFRRRPKLVIWVPIEDRGEATGSVTYQSYSRREVAEQELSLLEEVHRHLGVLVSNAFLNEVTRNQAVRLTALNAIARALSTTLDEAGIARELQQTLSQLLNVDELELVSLVDDDPDRVRVLRIRAGAEQVESFQARTGSRRLREAGLVMRSGRSRLRQESSADEPYQSAVSVPVGEGGRLLGALSILSHRHEAYEHSTIPFLEQVADEAALALQNARSYATVVAHRRRLEVVNAVGRRLASSLDRWSIMRTLREELARHLGFDLFVLMVLSEQEEGAPLAEGYLYDSGLEQPVPRVELPDSGPSRQAYDERRSVLVSRSPWARTVEAQRPEPESWVRGEGAAIFVTRRARPGRLATRSFVWVPVLQGDRVAALLSLQSYRHDAFDAGHVQLLEDVGAHVSLALANAGHYAAAQQERHRLEALHVLELGVAGSADEGQIAEAVFSAFRDYLDASHFVLAYLDVQGRLTGFGSESGRPIEQLEAQSIDRTHFFRRLAESGRPIVERVPEHLRQPWSGLGWATGDRRFPQHAVWVPVFHGERVVGALSAQRFEDRPFGAADVELLQGAAPVVGIALRTVRLHRSNELALAQSVHLQEVAAVAGSEIGEVVASVAEQARAMLGAAGVACWAFDTEGRVSALGAAGDAEAARVLAWSERDPGWSRENPPREAVSGTRPGLSWSLIPLCHADRLVGALGSVNPASALEDPGSAPLDFARHAAIAIENSRLVAETRGRIRTLQAVAAFSDLDITQADRARSEMGRLVSRALSGSNGRLWLLEGETLVQAGVADAPSIELANTAWLLSALRGGAHRRRLRELLRSLPASGAQPFASPILAQGRLMGLVTAEPVGAAPAEVRRSTTVLAGQAAVVLARLELVGALDRERSMMNAILRASPVGVMLLDNEGRVVYANQEIERIYGLAASAIRGRVAGAVLADAGATPRLDEEGVVGMPVELQLTGSDRVVQVRRVPIPGQVGQPAGELTLHEDITEEREALEAKDLMLRAIGHEVRSPAAAMKATMAGLMQWDSLIGPEKRRQLLEEAYEMSERLLNLVEGQLIIAKLETRRFEPVPASVDVGQALDQVLTVLQHRYGNRTAMVNIRLPERMPPALCEATHLEQVLANLVGNALEYTRGPVEVNARAASGWLEVEVVDHGSGLAVDRRALVFQKPGPAGKNRARGGLGLGLYLCRLVVERSFGGRIWVDRSGSTGTVFKFTVPAGTRSRRSAPPATLAPAR